MADKEEKTVPSSAAGNKKSVPAYLDKSLSYGERKAARDAKFAPKPKPPK